MYLYRTLFIALAGILFPFSLCAAQVRIAEIAWMGIAGANGQFGEWVELYNDGSAAVDLAGWKLYDGGGATLVFTLTKTIPANGYLLIERTTASMPDPVPGINDEQGTFGGGGFSNEGEDVVLKDASGVTVQTLPFASGWPAGDATTKETMQWNGASWITAAPTPGAATSSAGTAEEGETALEGTEERASAPAPAPKKYTPTITLDIPSDLYQYVEYTMMAQIMLDDGTRHRTGWITWNLGDGTSFIQQQLEPVTHRYRYPGTYTIWIGNYPGPFDKKPLLELSKTVKVGSPAVAVSVLNGEAVELTNHSSSMVDLSGWQVISGGQYAILPSGTRLAPDASVAIAADAMGFLSLPDVRLARPSGELLPLPIASTPAPSVRGAATASPAEWAAPDDSIIVDVQEAAPPMQNRTKKFIFGAAALVVVALCVLLERVMAKRE